MDSKHCFSYLFIYTIIFIYIYIYLHVYIFISLSMISIIMIIQFIIYWCIYVFLYACLCVCTVHACVHVADVNIRFLLSCSSPYVLRQAFFPKLRLPHSAGLSGQQALKDPLGSTISVLRLHAHVTVPGFFFTQDVRNQT